MRAAIVGLVLVATTSAHADDIAHDLAAARALEARLDYVGALRIIDQTLARGGSDTFQYVELHLLAGKLAAGLDRASEAQAHFARVLALRPNTTLPEGISPKISAPFTAAAARNVPLAITVTSTRGLVRITPTADPLGLVSGIAVHALDRAGTHRDVVDRRATRVVIPADATALEVTALDADGHRIWTGAVPQEPEVLPAPLPRETRSWVTRWPTWAVVTGVALGTAGVAAWRFDAAQDEWNRLRANPSAHDYSELASVEDRGDAWGLTANIAFGAAAIAGVATVILLLRGDSEPVVAPGSVGVAGRF